MATDDLKELGLTLKAQELGVNFNLTTELTLYTVPVGK